MLVSIVVPNYNHSRFLEERIECILKQTYQNFELIILDDFSNDDSRLVLKKYEFHPKITSIIFNQKNSGSTFSQWEKGINLAKGEWIWIAESDDWCEVSLLEELVNGAQKIPNAVLSFCQSLVIEHNKILWRSEAKNLEAGMDGKEFVATQMLIGNSIFNASMCIFKKEKYAYISEHFTSYKFCGDWLFWIEIALQGNVFISGKALNYFRKHTEDVSTSAFSQGLGYTEYYRLINHLVGLNHIDSAKANYLFQKKFKTLLLDNRIDKPHFAPIKNQYKKVIGSYHYLMEIWVRLHLVKKILKKRINSHIFD